MLATNTADSKYKAARRWRKSNSLKLLEPLDSTAEHPGISVADINPDNNSQPIMYRDSLLARSTSDGSMMTNQRVMSRFDLIMYHQRDVGFRADSIDNNINGDVIRLSDHQHSFNSERDSDISTTTDIESIDNSPNAENILQISGFLLKKSKEGAWQSRYFETTGTFLAYYKSKKKTKLLAALNLMDVSDVSVDCEVNDLLGPGVIFQLDMTDKRFLLRAKSFQQVDQWVKTLKRIKDNADTANAMAVPADFHASPKGGVPTTIATKKSSDTQGKGCCIIS